MKRTMILYEHPKALKDIQKWIKKKGLSFDDSDIVFRYDLKGESIMIMPSEHIYLHIKQVVTKLVLFGSFSMNDLHQIINKVIIDDQP